MDKDQAIEHVKNWIRLQEYYDFISRQINKSRELEEKEIWVVSDLLSHNLYNELHSLAQEMRMIQFEVTKASLDFYTLFEEVQEARIRHLNFETVDEVESEVKRLVRETVTRIAFTKAQSLFDESQYEEFISQEVRKLVSSYDLMDRKYLIAAFNLLCLCGDREMSTLCTFNLMELEDISLSELSINNLGDWRTVLAKGAEKILTELLYWPIKEKLDMVKSQIFNIMHTITEYYEELDLGIPQEVVKSITPEAVKVYPRESPLFKEIRKDLPEVFEVFEAHNWELNYILDSQINNQCAIVCDTGAFIIAFLWMKEEES